MLRLLGYGRYKRWFERELKKKVLYSGVMLAGSLTVGFLAPHSVYTALFGNFLSSDPSMGVFFKNAFVAGSLFPALYYLFVCSLFLLIGGYLYDIFNAPDLRYFEKLSFGQPDLQNKNDALGNIELSLKPHANIVHIAPKCREVDTIIEALKRPDKGFISIVGGYGEGKTTAAFHAAIRLEREDHWVPYALLTEVLERAKDAAALSNVLHQLDRLDAPGIKDKKRLIIVDDAHRLKAYKDMRERFRKEAAEKNARVIWIETQDYESESDENDSEDAIRIDFAAFLPTLLSNFYESADAALQPFQKRLEKLEQAKTLALQGKIKDNELFAKTALDTQKHVTNQLTNLLGNLAGQQASLVLFFIAAYTVMSSERRLTIRAVAGRLREASARAAWFDSTPERIEKLTAELEKLRIIKINKRNNEIESLLFNHAREIVRIQIGISPQDCVESYLSAAGLLLTNDYRDSINIGDFLIDCGERAAGFIDKNKAWFAEYFKNPIVDWIQVYGKVFRVMKNIDGALFREYYECSADELAKCASEVPVLHFLKLIHLLNALAEKKNNFLSNSFFDYEKLAAQANVSTVQRFTCLAILLRTLGAHSVKIVNKLDINWFINETKNVKITQFQQLSDLMRAIEPRSEELRLGLDMAHLISEADDPTIDQFSQLSALLHGLGSRSDEFLNGLNMEHLIHGSAHPSIEQFKSLSDLLHALGPRLVELLRELDMDHLIHEANEARIDQFQSVSDLIHALDSRTEEFVNRLDMDKLAAEASGAEIAHMTMLVHFITALGEQRIRFLANPLLNFNALLARFDCDVHGRDVGFKELASILDEDKKNCFAAALDWERICLDCTIELLSIRDFSISLGFLARKLSIGNDAECRQRTIQFLRRNTRTIVELFEKITPYQYIPLGFLLQHINVIDPELSREISRDVSEAMASRLQIYPGNYKKIGFLIDTLHGIDEKLARSFLERNIVRGHIITSINSIRDGQNHADLTSLIRALCKAAPDLLATMVRKKWIVLNPAIDLGAIYADVRREREEAARS